MLTNWVLVIVSFIGHAINTFLSDLPMFDICDSYVSLISVHANTFPLHIFTKNEQEMTSQSSNRELNERDTP